MLWQFIYDVVIACLFIALFGLKWESEPCFSVWGITHPVLKGDPKYDASDIVEVDLLYTIGCTWQMVISISSATIGFIKMKTQFFRKESSQKCKKCLRVYQVLANASALVLYLARFNFYGNVCGCDF